MTLAILHLSDIHFKSHDNPVADRADRIVAALRGADAAIEACLIAVSGDVAFSGQQDEYAVARTFFDQVRTAVASVPGIRDVAEVYIPGNHDCAFPANGVARTILLDTALARPSVLEEDDSVAVECLTVQDEFFAFLPAQTGEAPRVESAARLRYDHTFDLAGQRVVARCYNTAWMSRRHERPGSLLAPTWLPSDDPGATDLVVTLFHHPYGWLQPENAKDLKTRVERTSDIVLTGHEHMADDYSKRTIRGERSEYVEGAVLQGGDPLPGGFNIILIDAERRERRTLLYEWRGDHYAAASDGEWQPFERHRRAGTARFEPTPTFATYLSDAGAPFTHPQKSALTLDDIFVYPDLSDESDTYVRERAEVRMPSIIRGEDMFGQVRRHKRVLIMGGEKSGKTSLCKALYGDLLRAGIVPIRVDGEGLRVQDARTAARAVDACVADQYGPEMVERYRQLENTGRAVLVDDYHRARLGRRGQDAFLAHLEVTFDLVILIADDTFQLDELARRTSDGHALLSYRRWDIKELGHHLRAQLIERWLTIGQDNPVDERVALHRQGEIENLVTSVIGKNLLPAYPLFVLTILQMSEANTSHSMALGAFGYYYEVLITTALDAALTTHGRRLTIDTLYTFVAAVAYRQLELKRKYLTEDELDSVVADYLGAYKMSFDRHQILSILGDSRIYRKVGDDRYSFQYKYIYYYFVAKHMADNLHKPARGQDIRRHLERMTRALHVEDDANIILFFVYLTKDEETIGAILSEAKQIYAGYAPCDMDADLTALALDTRSEIPLTLGDERPRENRRRYRQEIDRVEESLQVTRGEIEGDAIEDEEGEHDLDEVLRLNVAVKTLQIMGQVLRNFPGTLEGETKHQLATESYVLGLRTVTAFLGIIGDTLDIFEEWFASFLRDRYGIEDEDEVGRRVDTLMSYLSYGVACSFIKRISQAVGSEHLKETFKDVRLSHPSTATDLIDIAIKLDHYQAFPEGEIDRLYTDLHTRHFPVQILRYLVFEHLYLCSVPMRTRQRVCAKLNIKANDPRLIGRAEKRIE